MPLAKLRRGTCGHLVSRNDIFCPIDGRFQWPWLYRMLAVPAGVIVAILVVVVIWVWLAQPGGPGPRAARATATPTLQPPTDTPAAIPTATRVVLVQASPTATFLPTDTPMPTETPVPPTAMLPPTGTPVPPLPPSFRLTSGTFRLAPYQATVAWGCGGDLAIHQAGANPVPLYDRGSGSGKTGVFLILPPGNTTTIVDVPWHTSCTPAYPAEINTMVSQQLQLMRANGCESGCDHIRVVTLDADGDIVGDYWWPP
jgi:hypothetical protein